MEDLHQLKKEKDKSLHQLQGRERPSAEFAVHMDTQSQADNFSETVIFIMKIKNPRISAHKMVVITQGL